MKVILRYIPLIIILLSILLLSGCVQDNSNTNPNSVVNSEPAKIESSPNKQEANNSSELIKEYVDRFYKFIDIQSSDMLKQFASKEGIVFIRTFISGFGTKGGEISETLDVTKLPSDLIFNFVKNEEPVSLKTEYEHGNKDFSKMKLVKSSEKFDWGLLIKPEILNIFGKVIGNEKEIGEETRVYILNDGSFCLNASC